MRVGYFLLVTALVEGATGLGLLIHPAQPVALLTGVETTAPETLVLGRVTGADQDSHHFP